MATNYKAKQNESNSNLYDLYKITVSTDETDKSVNTLVYENTYSLEQINILLLDVQVRTDIELTRLNDIKKSIGKLTK